MSSEIRDFNFNMHELIDGKMLSIDYSIRGYAKAKIVIKVLNCERYNNEDLNKVLKHVAYKFKAELIEIVSSRHKIGKIAYFTSNFNDVFHALKESDWL